MVGASGDLAKKKTYPALFALYLARLLPEQTQIWGFARSKKTNEQFRASLRPFLTSQGVPTEASIEQFLSLCFYRPGTSYGDYLVMTSILKETSSIHNFLFYLAIPPSVFGEATAAIKMTLGTVPLKGFVRVILEKPFGNDTESCQELLQTLGTQGWSENELYRIDHYLGKEMVQNLLTLRSENRWLKSLWNRDTIKAVHIVFKEPFGTEGRGGYFDPYGIIRDVIQNQ